MLQRDKLPQQDGLSHDEFMAISGLAPLPKLGPRSVASPLVYEQACSAIVECTRIDDAKMWSSKADALAAWAKLYANDRVSAEARRLKLHAYRRIAALADELFPAWRKLHGNSDHRLTTAALLKEEGFTQPQAQVVRKVGQLHTAKFNKAINAEMPPTPGTLVHVDAAYSPEYARIKRAMSVLRSILKHHKPENIAHRMLLDDHSQARIISTDLLEWMKRFHKALADDV